MRDIVILCILLLTSSCTHKGDKENLLIKLSYICLIDPCPMVILEDKNISVVEQFENRTIYYSEITLEEKQRLINVIKNIPLDSIGSSYVNNYADDGIQIEIEIQYSGKQKKVFILNYYLEEIKPLVSELNLLLPDTLDIWYPGDP